MDIQKLYWDYLGSQHMMQLATVHDGRPWCSTVYYVFDGEYNLYWASLPTRRHSQEIASEPRVAAAIAIKFTKGKPVVGIQVEGSAAELLPAEYPEDMVERYAEKFGRDEAWIKEFRDGTTAHRLYRLTPEHIEMFDEENFPGGRKMSVL
jgi:uncharacterized protein YhbP (UPF0306 family)